MDALARGGGLFLIAALACGAPAAGPPVGTSSYKPRGAAPPTVASARAPSPISADFRTRMQPVTARFAASAHFVGRYDAVIWSDAKDAWTGRSSYPDGARLVMEHLERGSDRVGPLLMMERRAGAWRYVMVASDGRTVVDGESRACSLCHAEAPQGGVFVVP